MKKPLKITLIVLAVLLVLAIAAFFILTSLYECQWVDGWGFYAHDQNSSTLALVPFPEIWNCRTLSNMNSVEQVGDHVYCAMNRNYQLDLLGIPVDTAVVFGSGKMWDFTTITYYGGASSESNHGLSPLYSSTVTKVILLDGVTNLSDSFIRGCGKLQTLYLPESIREFDCSAMNHCYEITGIYFQGNCPEFVRRDRNSATGFEPWNPLESAYPNGTVTVYYQPGTTGWDPAFWEDYAVLVEREYEIDWSDAS